MIRIALFAAILVSLLSPVSAQQLAEPFAFSLGTAGVQVMGQGESTCVIGNGGGISLPSAFASAALLRAAPAAALPYNDHLAVTHSFSSSRVRAELPLLTMPDSSADGYRHPRSLNWLPDAGPLFGAQQGVNSMAFEVPLLFPGLGQRENPFGAGSGEFAYRMSPDSHGHRHAGDIRVRADGVSFVAASAPASILPASAQDAMAGLHRLWNCVGSGAAQEQQQQQVRTATAEIQSAALTFPGQVNQLANNLGGLGRIYRADHSSGPALVVNRLVSASEEKLAFWVTQAEVDAAGVGCFKASADDSIAATRQSNNNIVIAMGPDFENKTFHVIFNGGLSGGVGGTVTTNDGAPGAHC